MEGQVERGRAQGADGLLVTRTHLADPALPLLPAPEATPNILDLYRRAAAQSQAVPLATRKLLLASAKQPYPLDIRWIDLDDQGLPATPAPAPVAAALAAGVWGDEPLRRVPMRTIYVRIAEPVPAAPARARGVHAALLAYLSDWFIISVVGKLSGLPMFASFVAPSSMDHSVHIHRADIDTGDWLLYTLECPVYREERALIQGTLWDLRGRRVATVVQEALVAVRPGRAVKLDLGQIVRGSAAKL